MREFFRVVLLFLYRMGTSSRWPMWRIQRLRCNVSTAWFIAMTRPNNHNKEQKFTVLAAIGYSGSYFITVIVQ